MNTIDLPAYSLVSYYRDKNNNPRGVLVAIPSGDNGDFKIGFAQCRKTDKFSKQMGLKIAIGRAEYENINSWNHAPHSIRKMLPAFVRRCERYYKVKI
jgi:hypothetical protein